jgi:hypothetical protein
VGRRARQPQPVRTRFVGQQHSAARQFATRLGAGAQASASLTDHGAVESKRWWHRTFTSAGTVLSSTCRATTRHRCPGPGSASSVDDASGSGAMSCMQGHAARTTSPPNRRTPNLVEDPLSIRVSHGHDPTGLAADLTRPHDAANERPGRDRRTTAGALDRKRRGKLHRFRWLAPDSAGSPGRRLALDPSVAMTSSTGRRGVVAHPAHRPSPSTPVPGPSPRHSLDLRQNEDTGAGRSDRTRGADARMTHPTRRVRA